jgi:acetyl-CoA acyltransferase
LQIAIGVRISLTDLCRHHEHDLPHEEHLGVCRSRSGLPADARESLQPRAVDGHRFPPFAENSLLLNKVLPVSQLCLDSSRVVTLDEGPRPDTSLESLAKLKPAFAAVKDPTGKATGLGSVTAGNSSQTSDGAGALILASERAINQFNLTPLARFVSFASRGVRPEIMGIGPIEAIPAALRSAGLQSSQLDWVELNEAFAAQSLAVLNSLDMDRSKVNPMGGAIALGHPLGATGAIRAATVIHALRRHQLKYGMVTMCVGTGQGAAGIFERL